MSRSCNALKTRRMVVVSSRIGISRRIMFFFIVMGRITALSPMTRRRLAMQEPMMFPVAMSWFP